MGLVLLVAVGFVASKMIPIKVKAAEFRQTIEDQAKSAGLTGHKGDYILKALLSKASDLDLPITEKDIVINRKSNNTIQITVEYVTPIEYPGYVHQWAHRHYYECPIF